MAQHDENVVWHAHPVTQQQREQHHGHRGVVLWFTGLSGSGKSTVAGALEEALHERGVSTYLLDGDNVRHGLCSDLGFSDEDRKENIRRVGEVARLMVDAGLVVLTAFISPHRAERQMVRERLGEGRFIEVFVDTPLAICEARDPKGLYKKARAGELRNFTGIDSVYEAPEKAEIHLDGEQLVTNLVHQLLDLLQQSDIIRSLNGSGIEGCRLPGLQDSICAIPRTSVLFVQNRLRRSATRPPGLCRALPWALFRGCWRWVFPSFSMVVIHSSFSSTPGHSSLR